MSTVILKHKAKMDRLVHSDHSDWTHDITYNATERDLNTTISASQVITASYALLFYLVILVLSILGVCFRACVKVFSSQASFLVFLIGTLMVCVNMFTNSGSPEVKIYFRLATGFLVGIAFVVAGAALFFSKPDDGAHQSTLARQQPSMGLVVGAITIPLIIAEIFLLVAASASKKEETSEALQKFWPFVVADKSNFLVQKIVQASIYILVLRYRTIRPRYKENAQFYFKALAFFNFMEWVDSQVNEDNDVELSHTKLLYGPWFDVFAVFYKALIIDYRLLCSLLFLEHSLEDETEDEASETDEPFARHLTISEQQCRTLGYMLGFTSLSAPICCALYYVPKLGVPSWVHVFAIIINLAIVGSGALFLGNNNLVKERKKGSSGVNIMVCFLGSVGITCWMIKAPIPGYWAATAIDRIDIHDPPYFAWVSAKYVARGISTAFLMGLFLKVDVRSLAQKNPDVKMNHFLVPAVMLAILGTFSETLIDQYVGPVDSRLRCEIKDLSLDILFEVGPPMYLGFLIHMFLHFLIIETEIIKLPGARVRHHAFPSYGALDNFI
ncbi:uncharacterized protein LOC144649749 isoform X1 [Oculina patagonica]